MLLLLFIIIGVFSYLSVNKIGIQSASEKAKAIIEASIVNIDAEKFAGLVLNGSDTDVYYEDLRKYLFDVKKNTGCKYLYTMIYDGQTDAFSYIADGNDPADEKEFSAYGDSEPANDFPNIMKESLNSDKTLCSDIYKSEDWGSLLTASRAIKTADGKTAGLLACDYSAEQVAMQSAKFRNTLFVFIFPVLILLLGANFFLLKSMLKPLMKFSDLFKKGSSGDLSVRMNIKSNDEIGEMSASYNDFMNMLSNFSNQMKLISEDKLFDGELDKPLPGDMEKIREAIVNNLRKIAENARYIANDDLYNEKLNVSTAGALGGAFADMLANLRTITNQVKLLAEEKIFDSSLKIQNKGDLQSAFAELISKIRNIAEIAETISKGAIPKSLESLKSNGVLSSSLGGMILIFEKLLKQADAIANNDLNSKALSEKLPGEIGASFIKMTENLKRLISHLEIIINETKNTSKRISEMVNATVNSANEFIENSSEQSLLITDTDAALTEFSASIKEIMNSCGKSKGNIENSKEILKQGVNLIRNVSKHMETISDSIKLTSNKLQELNESGKRIGNIVDIITSISEKTALLALNAAIEAARAGEAGRGFAVVADEVNKLADQTNKSVKEIAGLVETIQVQTHDAVDSMNKGIQLAATGVSLTEESTKSFDSITGVIEESNESLIEISQAVNEQTKTISLIVATSEKLKSSSQLITTKSNNLKNNSGELTKDIQKLTEILSK